MKNLFQRLRSRNGSATDGDAWVEGTLASLDPGRRDPRYWPEFQRAVMLSAGAELARRRRLAELTVSDVVFSWSRGLVPAAAAASLAAFFLLRPAAAPSPAPLRLEEALFADNVEVSASDVSNDLAGEISFAVDVY